MTFENEKLRNFQKQFNNHARPMCMSEHVNLYVHGASEHLCFEELYVCVCVCGVFG